MILRRNKLNKRLDDVAKEIYNKLLEECLQLVDKAEKSLAVEDYNNALNKVNKLPNGNDKTTLLDRLSKIAKEISNSEEKSKLIKEVERYVKYAEDFKKESYIITAETKVNVLPDCPEKTAFLERLDKVREGLAKDELKEDISTAEQKVKLAEALKRDPYIKNAFDEVAKLPNCPEKDSLIERLNKLSDNIYNPPVIEGNTKEEITNATNVVEQVERSKSQYFYDKAVKVVDALKDSAEKTNLKERLANVYKAMNPTELEKAIKEATDYVSIAEKYGYEYYVNKATALVNALEDCSEKTALMNRLNSLK